MSADAMEMPAGARLQQACDRLQTFLDQRACLFPALRSKHHAVLERLENLSYHQGRIESALVILLLGGTGTGKSTLINALAGQSISQSDVRRGFTDHYVIYHHAETPVAFLAEVTGPEDEWTLHRRDSLRHKVIVDAPDFDSVKEFNNLKATTMLEAVDLAVVVVTSEKYRDLILYQILQASGHTKKLLFVYNKVDLVESKRVEEQLRAEIRALGLEEPRIYCISAKNALENRLRGGPERPEGDFEDLVGYLHEELDRTQIRRIKAANLDRLLDGIVQDVGEGIPDDLRQVARDLEAEVATAIGGVGRSLARLLDDSLLTGEGRELNGLYKSLQYHSFSGPLGIYLSVLDWFAALRPGHIRAGGVDGMRLRALVRAHAAPLPPDRVRETLDGMREHLVGCARRCGVDEEMMIEPLASAGGSDLSGELSERVSEAITDRFLAEFGRLVLRQGGGFRLAFRNALYNLLPVSFLLFFLTRLGVLYFAHDQFLGLDYVVSSFVLLVALCGVLHIVADKGCTRRRWLFLAELERIASRTIESFLEGEIGAPLSESVARLDRTADEWEALGGGDELR